MTPALRDFNLFVRPRRLGIFHFYALRDFTVVILGDGDFKMVFPTPVYVTNVFFTAAGKHDGITLPEFHTGTLSLSCSAKVTL
jgi:hypothetical protein